MGLSLHAGAANNSKNAVEDTIKITRVNETDVDINVDGVLDEAIWQTLPIRDEMVIVDPDTLTKAPKETRTHFFYTDKGLYIGVWNEQDKDQLISRLSSRDQFISRDGISITIDPSGEGLYAYWFSVNLGGTVGDGTVMPERQYSNQWDGAWRGAAAEHDEGWSAEYFIPWSIMSMPDTHSNTREMGYSITRSVAHVNERWAYPPLSRREGVFLSRLQKIELESINPKQQFALYPFAASTYNNVAVDHNDSYKAGFDFFWRPSTNMQLTATVNPDFGNVESDNVVVNLSSFETFYPEKRAFFLEGQEIFVTTPRARQGRFSRGSPTTVVNTRRIGSAPKSFENDDFELTDLEANQPSELAGAVKITGQQDNFRYGILTAMEDDTKLTGEIDGTEVMMTQDGRDFGVARFLYEDTSTGARRSLGWISTLVSHPQEDAMVHGMDGHYLSRDGVWNTDAQLLFSDVDDVNGAGGFVDITYTPTRGSRHELAFEVELDINDLGFLRRNDSIGVSYSYNRNNSSLKQFKSRYTGFNLVQKYNTDHRSTGTGIFFSQDMEFFNNNSMYYQLRYFPEKWEDRESEEADFRVEDRWQIGGRFRTDRSRKLMAGAGLFYKKEDIGGYSIDYDLELAWRPTDRFALITRMRYEDKQGWLLHYSGRKMTTFDAENWRPEIEMDVFLSAKQQFRVTAQWAGIKAFEDRRWEIPAGDGELQRVEFGPGDKARDFSISRLTFQARYRWEIAPLSDLFVVYTRGSNVDSMPHEDFDNLLRDSWTDRLVDVFVVKLRYRMGS